MISASRKPASATCRERFAPHSWSFFRYRSERGTRFLERLGTIVDKSGVPVSMSGIPPMPFITFDRVDGHYKERRVEFYTQCIRRGLFVQPYHHWYIAYRHTEADLNRALEVVEESLAWVAQSHPWEK